MMQLILIRHSQAEAREEWNDVGNPDNLRPLTKKGIRRCCDAISGLSKFVPEIDYVYSSQYTRAIQTAEMVHGHYKGSQYEIIEDLNPGGKYKNIKKFLDEFGEEDVVAMVGHQPELSALLSYLIGSNKDLLIRFKKGGASLVSYLNGMGQIQWLLTQRQLCLLSEI